MLDIEIHDVPEVKGWTSYLKTQKSTIVFPESMPDKDYLKVLHREFHALANSIFTELCEQYEEDGAKVIAEIEKTEILRAQGVQFNTVEEYDHPSEK